MAVIVCTVQYTKKVHALQQSQQEPPKAAAHSL